MLLAMSNPLMPGSRGSRAIRKGHGYHFVSLCSLAETIGVSLSILRGVSATQIPPLNKGRVACLASRVGLRRYADPIAVAVARCAATPSRKGEG